MKSRYNPILLNKSKINLNLISIMKSPNRMSTCQEEVTESESLLIDGGIDIDKSWGGM